MGSGASSRPKAIKGTKLCEDAQLQELLEAWINLGVCFTGVMLFAEGKESEQESGV